MAITQSAVSRLVLLLPLALCVPSAAAAERVCAPRLMLKVVTALDMPGVPKDHFARVPKTLYRYSERLGRLEEQLNPETQLHLLIVVAEPHVWIVDRAAGRGMYQKDPGPTYYFRARILDHPEIDSLLMKSLEFGCETSWLVEAGASRARMVHPALGGVERLVYREGKEAVHLYLRSGRPVRLELRRDGQLLLGVDYLEYIPDLPVTPALFERPAGYHFSGEESK